MGSSSTIKILAIAVFSPPPGREEFSSYAREQKATASYATEPMDEGVTGETNEARRIAMAVL